MTAVPVQWGNIPADDDCLGIKPYMNHEHCMISLNAILLPAPAAYDSLTMTNNHIYVAKMWCTVMT
eukprot:CAMPEP_0176503740 /NCGR_PEP_ID=MMETSP0200_2-20121128/15536_1 /TAXON_ID=947934 /ORGANISM="Chaetoceros sp., Strain GSL56" /LENGTH=65 /DNA_ID=CAMNT_0017903075 /DNA_START=79 /DNA_END=272 /DNA_ORIENTATION=+